MSERDSGRTTAGTLTIRNCRACLPDGVIEEAVILIRDGKIARVGPAGGGARAGGGRPAGSAGGAGPTGGGAPADVGPAVGGAPTGAGGGQTLDAGGRLAVPGFIDVHVHGADGRDVLDGSPEDLAAVARACARCGVTGFLSTTVWRPGQGGRHLEMLAAAPERTPGGADLLGLHLEGPFLAPARRGMIRPDCLADPSPALLEEILVRTGGRLRMMTVAPELPGALETVAALAGRGIVASFGHSAAGYEETRRGIEAGIRHVTHLFNAMQPLHHREPGPIPALLEAEEVTAQVIFDGVHLHPAVLRLVARLLGPRRLALITDGMRSLGLPDGWYVYDGLPYETRDGTARYRDGTLIGTALGLNLMVERCRRLGGLGTAEAVRAATLTPAAALGLADRKGSLEPGKDADVALLEPDFTVWKTIRGGEIIYG